jgi:hypothetical protein
MNRSDTEIHDPVFGFKRDLIRLIGNLCYKSKENQDLVRIDAAKSYQTHFTVLQFIHQNEIIFLICHLQLFK